MKCFICKTKDKFICKVKSIASKLVAWVKSIIKYQGDNTMPGHYGKMMKGGKKQVKKVAKKMGMKKRKK